MANYRASARTSYAKVKDENAFLEWADGMPIDVWQKEDATHGTLYAFGNSDDGDTGGWPSVVHEYDADSGEYTERDIDLAEGMANHLAENWSITFMEIGAEKLRYLIGNVVVINWRGDREMLCLNQLAEDAAKRLSEYATEVLY